MRIARKTSTQSHNNSDTCESIRLDAPSKIIQTNIKLTYHHLTSLPVLTHCNHVTHFYLSHNQIASLKGIEHYPLLVSLNISYNCLTKIGEMKWIAHPEKMDKINLRMNQFQYGYEDEVVRLFPNLRKLEGEKLGERKVKDELGKMKTFISQGLIDFYRKSEEIIEAMNCHEQDKENIDTNKPLYTKNKIISTEFMNNIFFNKLKDAYIHPSQELLRRKNIYSLTNLCFTLVETLNITDIYTCKKRQKDDYMESTRKTYQQICKIILLKFSSRNDRTLISYLEVIKSEEGQAITSCFARLGNFEDSKAEDKKTHSIITNPSRYMKKIQKKELIDHPMNKLANWQPPQYRTLIPSEQTKWHHFHNHPQQQQEQAIHQQIPIFVYCKEYIEVIADLILNQVGKILSLEHQIMASSLTCPQKEGMSDEIQLDLSNSQVMSFGQRQQDPQPFQQSFSHNNLTQGKTVKIEPRSNSFLFHPSEQSLPPKTQKRKQQQASLNLNKYSIYQINLIFKSFRTLKINLKHQNI